MSVDSTLPPPADPPPLYPGARQGPAAHGKRWAVAAVALVLAALVWFLAGKTGKAKAEKEKGRSARPIPVAGVPARSGDMPVALTGLGTVTPLATVTVKSRIDGQLGTVTFREGQLVSKGDLLAEIDPRPYEVQLQQAEGQLAKDESALQNARVDLARYQALVAQDAISRQQLDTQAAAVVQIEAAIRSDQAQVASARLNLTYCRITAPITGRVGLRLVDSGNMIHAADPNGLLVITQVQPIAVVFTLAGDQLPPVLKQLRAGKSLAVEAWDRDVKTRLAEGRLDAVDNQIDPATGTVKLKAVFANADFGLFPNQFVNARLVVDELRGAVLIPTAALQRSPQAAYVWVVKADSTAEMRTVEAALTEGEETAVRKGLAPGEVVVVDGTDRLQNGSPVQLASPGGAAPEPGPARNGGKKKGA